MKSAKSKTAKTIMLDLVEDCRSNLQEAAKKMFDEAGVVSTVSICTVYTADKLEINITLSPSVLVQEAPDSSASLREELKSFGLNQLKQLAGDEDINFGKNVGKDALIERLLANVSVEIIRDFIAEEEGYEEEDEEDEDDELADDLSMSNIASLEQLAKAHGLKTEKHKGKFKSAKAEGKFKRVLIASLIRNVSEDDLYAFIDAEEDADEEDEEAPRSVKKQKVTLKETLTTFLAYEYTVNDLKRICFHLDVHAATARKIKGEPAPTKLEMSTALVEMRKPQTILEALKALDLPHPVNSVYFK